MIESPVYNAGKRSFLAQLLRLRLISVRFKAVVNCGIKNIGRVAPVAGYAAVLAHLLQRNPFIIICHDHAQAGCPTFQGFQLHDDRYLCNPFANRLLFLFCHTDLLQSAVSLSHM